MKFETERLTFIRLNQAKQRSEEYIHLRDAINVDGNVQNVGRQLFSQQHTSQVRDICMNMLRMLCRMYVIIHMQSAVDRKSTRIMFRQSPIDRHDITARLFKINNITPGFHC